MGRSQRRSATFNSAIRCLATAGHDGFGIGLHNGATGISEAVRYGMKTTSLCVSEACVRTHALPHTS